MTIAEWLDDNLEAARLARLASLAAEIEPELLRELRIALLPTSPTEIEADIWFSPLVESRSPAAIVFSNEALAELWKAMPMEKLSAARSIVRRFHFGITPLAELHEEIVYHSLAGQDDELKSKLKSFLDTIVQPEYADMSKWAARILPRMPQTVKDQREEEVGLWDLSARALVDRGTSVSGTGALPAPAWLTAAVTEETTLGVRLFGREIEIVHPPGSDTMTVTMAGGFPGKLIYDTDEKFTNPQTLTIRSSSAVRGPVPSGKTVFLRSPGGKTYSIDPIRHEGGLPHVLLGLESTEWAQNVASQQDELSASIQSLGITFEIATAEEIAKRTDFPANSTLLWATEDLAASKKRRNHRRALWAGLSVIFLRLPIHASTWTDALEPEDEWVDFQEARDYEDSLQELFTLLQRPRQFLGSLNGVPPLPWHYVRTNDESNLAERIIHSSSPNVMWISGDAGRGKSTSLAALARDREVRASFPGGIFWLDREDPGFQPPTSRHLVICDFEARQEFVETLRTSGSTVVAVSTGAATNVGDISEIGQFYYEDALNFLIDVSGGEISTADWSGFQKMKRVDRQILAMTAACSRASLGYKALYESLPESNSGSAEGRDLSDALMVEIRETRMFPQLDSLLHLMPHAPITHAGINRIKPFRDLVTLDTIDRLTDFALCTRISPTCFSMNDPQLRVVRKATHSDIISSFGPFDPVTWHSIDDAGYGMRAMVWHLMQVEETDMAHSLVLDLDWLLAKLAWGGIGTVIDDYRLAGVFHSESQLSDFEREITRAFAKDDVLGFFADGNSLPDRKHSINLQSRAKARKPFQSGEPIMWVLVAGTGMEKVSESVRRASLLLGRELARAGHGLISGGWPGVDRFVCEGFIRESERLEVDPSKVLRLVTNVETPAIWGVENMRGKGRLEYVQSEREAVYASVREAGALLVVGGLGGTEEIAGYAREMGIPIVPVRGTGNYADKVDFKDWYLERNSDSKRLRSGEDIWQAVEFAMLNLMRELNRRQSYTA